MQYHPKHHLLFSIAALAGCARTAAPGGFFDVAIMAHITPPHHSMTTAFRQHGRDGRQHAVARNAAVESMNTACGLRAGTLLLAALFDFSRILGGLPFLKLPMDSVHTDQRPYYCLG